MRIHIAAILFSLLVAPASANWQSISDGQGMISAQSCGTEPTPCVRLQCVNVKGGAVYWHVDATDPGHGAETTLVSWMIDGRMVSEDEMSRTAPVGHNIQGYNAQFDPVRHGVLLGALKMGSTVTVRSDQFTPFTVSLRGSADALNQMLAACPLIDGSLTARDAPMPDPARRPIDVVAEMMASQGCKATESQIFEAITGGGFGIWDANQFIVIGADDGTLEPLGQHNGIHRFRLPGCTGAGS